MTTTCEHGRERATCPECGALATITDFHGGISPEALAATHGGKNPGDWQQAAVDEAVEKEFGGTRPLTDVEEKWVRMKHPEMSEAELQALIAEGLPADVAPITREDLKTPAPPEPEHFFPRPEWDRRKKARKTAQTSRRRNRVKKHRPKSKKR